MTIAGKKIEYHELSTKSGQSLYAVSYLDFPKHWKIVGTKKILSKSFDLLLDNEEVTTNLLKKNFETHRGKPSLDYHFEKGKNQVQGKFIVSGNTLYRIAVTSPLKGATGEDVEQFLNSLELKG